MMNKKVLILILFLFLFMNVSAKVNNIFDTAASYSNRYIDSFKDNEKYIVKSSGDYIIPFNYENGVLSTNSSFKNGGMISLYEFKNTIIKNNSYLVSGQEYWTLTSNDSSSNYCITHKGYESKKLEEFSALRVTEQVMNHVKVSGSGTKNDPWVFLPLFKVVVKNSTPSYGNVYATATSVYKGDTASIVLEPKLGYDYDTDTCSTMKVYFKNKNNISIRNVSQDIVCVFSFKPKTFTVSFDSNGGSDCDPSSNNYKLGDTYNLSCNPTRNGFDFDGWYTELDGGTKLATSTEITNYDVHSIYAHWIAKPITLSNQSFQAYYSSVETVLSMVGASGGSGLYNYNISGTGAENFSITANAIYVKAGTAVGTYSLDIEVTDFYSKATATAKFTINIINQTTTTTTTTRRITTRDDDIDYTTTKSTTRSTTKAATKSTTKKTTTKSSSATCKCDINEPGCVGGIDCSSLGSTNMCCKS